MLLLLFNTKIISVKSVIIVKKQKTINILIIINNINKIF